MVGLAIILADSTGAVTELLKGTGITVVGVLAVMILALVKGWIVPGFVLARIEEAYKGQLESAARAYAELKERTDKYEERAWEGAKIADRGIELAKESQAVATKAIDRQPSGTAGGAG
jgi:hypothetical protein